MKGYPADRQRGGTYAILSMPVAVTAPPGKAFPSVVVLILLMLAYEFCAYAQSPAVTNVQVEVMEKDGTIVLHYDLGGSGNASEVFKVTVAVSTNGGAAFPLTPRLVTGDFGGGVHPGVGKRIVWNVRDDVKRLQSDTVVFRISAEMELPPRISGLTSEVGAAEAVSFRVKCNFAAPGYVFLRDGTLSVSRASIALTLPIRNTAGPAVGSVVDYGFSITPDRVLEVKRHGQGIRVRVVVKDWKGKDDKQNYYLYNASSTTFGVGPDGQIRVLGVSALGGNIACQGCDDTMEKLYALLLKAATPVR